MVGARHVAWMLLALSAGCERGATVQRDTPVAAVVPETTVRRVLRVLLRPSAIQRITGRIEHVAPLRALDSTLAVRVLDQRGAALSGVPVTWTPLAPAPGVKLQVSSPVTDSLGESRASYTPGLTASRQGASASVSEVGSIDFTMQVAAARITTSPPSMALWTGEEADVTALLRDSSDRTLEGGAVAWGASDTAIVIVARSDSLSATVRGIASGTASVVAFTSDRIRAATRVIVRPTIEIRFVDIAGNAIVPEEVSITSNEMERPLEPANVTRARVELPQFVDVAISARFGVSEVHPVRVRVLQPRELERLTVIALPTSWTIDRGTYAGTEVRIDAIAALAGPSGGFWRSVPRSGVAARQILTWPSSALPLRIAFNRARSRGDPTAADSIAFWAAARQVEADIGLTLFAPAELSGGERGAGIVTIEIGGEMSEGHAFVTWNDRGAAFDGVLSFARVGTLRRSDIVTHELLHLLGFGHTVAWSTAAAPSPTAFLPRLSATDVAHVQLAMAVRRLVERLDARPGFPASVP